MTMLTPDDNSVQAETSVGGSLKLLLECVADDLSRVNGFIDRQLTCPFEPVNELLSCIPAGRGKMLRSALVFLSGRSCGAVKDEHLKIASIIELVHTASLLHDDVLDNAKSRRQMPTANILHGNEAAVLLGDLLLSKVFQVGSELNDSRVSLAMSETAERLCLGELLQNTQRNNWNLDEKTYFDIITGKTAALFGTACYLGAVVSDADTITAYALRDYGLSIGMAFQITDDILDILGDESKMGKTTGSDIDGLKLTLPLINYLNTLDTEKKDQAVQMAMTDYNEIFQRMEVAGSIDYALRKAKDFVAEGIDALDLISSGDSKDTLIKIARYIIDRNS